MKTDDISVDYLFGRDELTQDAAFYCDGSGTTQVAVVSAGERSVSVYCLGVMRVWDHRSGHLYLTTQDLLDAGLRTDRGLEEAERDGHVEFENNPWFELFVDGEPLGNVVHSLDEAVALAVDHITGGPL